MKFRHSLRPIVLGIGFTALAHGQSEPESIDTFIQERMKEARVPGLATVLIDGEGVLWEGYYGKASIEEDAPVDGDTLFQLASISKTITACAIMKLVEDGKIDLDGDINDVLPIKVRNPSHPKTPITMRQLLTHTSGIRDNWNVLEGTWVTNGDFPQTLGKSLASYLVKGGKHFSRQKNYYPWKAGTDSDYANVGVALAAYVAEVAADRPFEELAEEYVLNPLGLQPASYRIRDLKDAPVAMPYLNEDEADYKAAGHHGYLDFPSGTLRMTAPHLARFMRAFVQGGSLDDTRILKEETVKEMKRIQFPEVAPEQGLAWYVTDDFGEDFMGHDGGDPGVSTLMYYRVRDNLGMVVLMNAEPSGRRFERGLTKRLIQHADRLLTEKAKKEKQSYQE